jgi:drug/metabolite transporter (DMT)-like permease
VAQFFTVFKSVTKHHLLLHLIVFIWGWSPILGKQISVQALQLVWFRMGMTIIVIALYNLYIRQKFLLTKIQLFQLIGTGAVIAFHWFCFYQAIKISNVSVTLAAFATGTLFTSIIEPIFYKRKILWYEIVFGLIIIGAIGMIFQVETQYTLGIMFGVLAAFTSSLFTVWNGILVRNIPSPVISLVELAGGFACLSAYLLCTGEFTPEFLTLSTSDIWFLILFSVVGTAFPFIASTNLLKQLSPFTVTLTVNLETVYGIIIAYLLWKQSEQMTIEFYIATIIILAVIILNAVLKTKLQNMKFGKRPPDAIEQK